MSTIDPRRICIVLTTRGNYAKMKSTMAAIRDEPALSLQVVVGGPLLNSDYTAFSQRIESDGFIVTESLPYPTGDTTLRDTAISAAGCMHAAADLFCKLDPHIVLLIADRYEVLALAQAALSLNIHIAHLEGGEVSGSIDERIRHAVTKLSHIHFPSNQDSAERVERLGEERSTIHVVGSPSLDLLNGLELNSRAQFKNELAESHAFEDFDLMEDYVVVSQHPVVTEIDHADTQFQATADAVRQLGLPAVWLRPNVDAGARSIDAVLEGLVNDEDAPPIHIITSLHFEDYARLIRYSCCLIGNSSSGIRESAFLGVPAINIGERQRGRSHGVNVIDVMPDATEILEAAQRQVKAGLFQQDTIYGDGTAGEKIARVLKQDLPLLDKPITF